jgi:hypothetical protein
MGRRKIERMAAALATGSGPSCTQDPLHVVEKSGGSCRRFARCENVTHRGMMKGLVPEKWIVRQVFPPFRFGQVVVQNTASVLLHACPQREEGG